FRIVRLTYTNAVLFPPMLLIRWRHRARGLSADAGATAEIAVPAQPVQAALSALLFLESVWLNAGGTYAFGSSLLCLAREPGGAALHCGFPSDSRAGRS